MKNYRPTSTDMLCVRVASYALNRISLGLPGLPSHPRNRNATALRTIAHDIQVPVQDLCRIDAYLQDLRACPDMSAALPSGRAAAIATITRTYQERPIPCSASGGILWGDIASATGVSGGLLYSDDCRATVTALAAANGTALPPPPDIAGEIATLEIYVDGLRLADAPLPWNQRFQHPAYAVIARATGIPTQRLEKGDVAIALLQLASGIAKQAVETRQQQAARLAAHVDAAIAQGVTLPFGPKGTRYKEIGAAVNIPDHHLRMPVLAAEIERWRNASTRTATEVCHPLSGREIIP